MQSAVKPSFDRKPSKAAEALSQPLYDHYRCPAGCLNFDLSAKLSADRSYFRFAGETLYGRSVSTARNLPRKLSDYDFLEETSVGESQVKLRFDPAEVIDNLRWERYPYGGRPAGGDGSLQKKLYYLIRPLTNLAVRRQIQKFHARNWEKQTFPRWPVDTTVENVCEKLLSLSIESQGVDRLPFVWFWPAGAPGCALMTHDVENQAGQDFCDELMDLDDSFGVKASFQIVPEGRYAASPGLLSRIRNRGFEVGIQDLNHDGRLYDNREEFLRRVARINRYGAEYGARGFRAAVLYRNLELYDKLDFSYDLSVPNVAHLDPQRGGCCTVMPYFVGNILEIPVTTAQDYTLFHLLNQRSIDLWKTQVELILGKCGMASFIIHPDYVMDADTKAVYVALLEYLQGLKEKKKLWFALPSEVDSWWRARREMSVVRGEKGWRIEGEGAERAVLAYARNVDGKLVYEMAELEGAR